MNLATLEKTGPNYSVEKMLTARRKTTEGVLRIAERIAVNPSPVLESAYRSKSRFPHLKSARRDDTDLVNADRAAPRNFRRRCSGQRLSPHRELAVPIASLAISVASAGRCVRVQQASVPNYSPTERKSK
jgi:hypothetical protein